MRHPLLAAGLRIIYVLISVFKQEVGGSGLAASSNGSGVDSTIVIEIVNS
jgi:hypothetical protein